MLYHAPMERRCVAIASPQGTVYSSVRGDYEHVASRASGYFIVYEHAGHCVAPKRGCSCLHFLSKPLLKFQ